MISDDRALKGRMMVEVEAAITRLLAAVLLIRTLRHAASLRSAATQDALSQ